MSIVCGSILQKNHRYLPPVMVLDHTWTANTPLSTAEIPPVSTFMPYKANGLILTSFAGCLDCLFL